MRSGARHAAGAGARAGPQARTSRRSSPAPTTDPQRARALGRRGDDELSGGQPRARGSGGRRGGATHARVVRDGAPGLGFLLDAVGPGTHRLGELEPGEELWLSGPFGVGFRPVPASDHRPVLVGGGIGAAPILALADELDSGTTVLLGFRSAAHADAAELFAATVAVATDDGSRGRHALVTDLLREELDRDPEAVVYACGPPPMLEAVRALCAARGTQAQLALESGMACGFGACFGCVVPTRNGFVRLCLDGPVLDADRLETGLFEGAGQ